MTDPDEEMDRFRAEMDQSIEAMTELSRALWRLFSDLQEQGFSESQALTLTLKWLGNMATSGEGGGA